MKYLTLTLLFLVNFLSSIIPSEGAIGDAMDIISSKNRVASFVSSSSATTDIASLMPKILQIMHSEIPNNSTDCQAYLLMYQYALSIQPERAPLSEVFDSLQLEKDCNITPPDILLDKFQVQNSKTSGILSYNELDTQCSIGPIYVEPNTIVSSSSSLSNNAPSFSLHNKTRPLQGLSFSSLHTAVNTIRQYRIQTNSLSTACILLKKGTHSLEGQTLMLSSDDSHLIITGDPNSVSSSATPSSWLSGGTVISNLVWTPYNVNNNMNIWKTTISSSYTNITTLLSLNSYSEVSVPTRYILAQYPNFDPETAFTNTWISPSNVVLWHKPPNFTLPQQYFVNLTDLGLKNDSTMPTYNYYGTGVGGPCSLWTGDPEQLNWSYWCSNYSAGGWAFVDNYMSKYGILQLPIGLTYNASKLNNKFSNWNLPPAPYNQKPEYMPLLTAFMDQTWFTDTFAITSVDPTNAFFNLTWDNQLPSGGWQGGRNWHTQDSSPSTNLISGPWFVSNILEELDAPGEFYFDPVTRSLYLYYNASSNTSPPSNLTLSAPNLETLINLTGTSPLQPIQDVVITGIGLRDQIPALLNPWFVPSGGDWSVRPCGAVVLQNTERINITNNMFYRLDANGIFLYSYNRNASILNNEFAWLGMSAIVFYGTTVQEDATDGYQPWGTVIDNNYFHELGVLEKQSSAVFFSKTPLTRVSNNIMYNGPRAMINLNDNTGGNINITNNAIWNTCRVSGDHGPINSWDRLPYATRIRSNGENTSYSAAYNDISHNYIISNYGGSQGFDTDDGSSWNIIHDNFYYQSSGFKMDYGGHDSMFHDNVVISYNNENCLGTAHFVVGHEDKFFNNKCVNPVGEKVDDLFENCHGGPGTIQGNNNQYFTPLANASASCDGSQGNVPLSKLGPGVETNFTSSTLPSAATIIQWAKEKLNLP